MMSLCEKMMERSENQGERDARKRQGDDSFEKKRVVKSHFGEDIWTISRRVLERKIVLEPGAFLLECFHSRMHDFGHEGAESRAC